MLDALLAISVASWGASVMIHREGPPLAVRIAIASLDLAVAALFLARGAPLAQGSWRAIALAIPSIVAATAAVRIAPEAWPRASEIAFCACAALAIASLSWLGRSFAILPARRALVVRGPYALVRHPAYLCELAMAIAAGSATSWGTAVLVGVIVALSLVPRIREEEALLADDPRWREYAARVRSRLVPGVF